MKEIVTGDDVLAVPEGGELSAGVGAVITPWARDLAAARHVRIVQRLGGGPTPATLPETGGEPRDTIAVGADHGGFPLKEEVRRHLERLGYGVLDVGTHSTDPVDYPDLALAVAQAVRAGRARLGIVVDAAGIGSSIAANKVQGVRAALCHDVAAARNAREHNDANVMTLGAKFIDPPRMREVVEAFLTHRCSEERHLRRVGIITAYEDASQSQETR